MAGCGFGCFFILISRVHPTTTFWPLVVSMSLPSFHSLYPAATVGLAALVLRERVVRIQTIGIVLLLLAIPVISA